VNKTLDAEESDMKKEMKLCEVRWYVMIRYLPGEAPVEGFGPDWNISEVNRNIR